MMNTQLLRLSLCLAFAGAALMAIGGNEAGAQEQVGASILDEITVTARRREESLMDTPVSITAFTDRKSVV